MPIFKPDDKRAFVLYDKDGKLISKATNSEGEVVYDLESDAALTRGAMLPAVTDLKGDTVTAAGMYTHPVTGILYVLDSVTKTVKGFVRDGSIITRDTSHDITGLEEFGIQKPTHLYISGGFAYILDSAQNRLFAFNPETMARVPQKDIHNDFIPGEWTRYTRDKEFSAVVTERPNAIYFLNDPDNPVALSDFPGVFRSGTKIKGASAVDGWLYVFVDRRLADGGRVASIGTVSGVRVGVINTTGEATYAPGGDVISFDSLTQKFNIMTYFSGAAATAADELRVEAYSDWSYAGDDGFAAGPKGDLLVNTRLYPIIAEFLPTDVNVSEDPETVVFSHELDIEPRDPVRFPADPPVATPTAYEWIDHRGRIISTTKSLEVKQSYFGDNPDGTYTFAVRARSECGWGNWTSFSITFGHFYSLELFSQPVWLVNGHTTQAHVSGWLASPSRGSRFPIPANAQVTYTNEQGQSVTQNWSSFANDMIFIDNDPDEPNRALSFKNYWGNTSTYRVPYEQVYGGPPEDLNTVRSPDIAWNKRAARLGKITVVVPAGQFPGQTDPVSAEIFPLRQVGGPTEELVSYTLKLHARKIWAEGQHTTESWLYGWAEDQEGNRYALPSTTTLTVDGRERFMIDPRTNSFIRYFRNDDQVNQLGIDYNDYWTDVRDPSVRIYNSIYGGLPSRIGRARAVGGTDDKLATKLATVSVPAGALVGQRAEISAEIDVYDYSDGKGDAIPIPGRTFELNHVAMWNQDGLTQQAYILGWLNDNGVKKPIPDETEITWTGGKTTWGALSNNMLFVDNNADTDNTGINEDNFWADNKVDEPYSDFEAVYGALATGASAVPYSVAPTADATLAKLTSSRFSFLLPANTLPLQSATIIANIDPLAQTAGVERPKPAPPAPVYAIELHHVAAWVKDGLTQQAYVFGWYTEDGVKKALPDETTVTIGNRTLTLGNLADDLIFIDNDNAVDNTGLNEDDFWADNKGDAPYSDYETLYGAFNTGVTSIPYSRAPGANFTLNKLSIVDIKYTIPANTLDRQPAAISATLNPLTQDVGVERPEPKWELKLHTHAFGTSDLAYQTYVYGWVESPAGTKHQIPRETRITINKRNQARGVSGTRTIDTFYRDAVSTDDSLIGSTALPRNIALDSVHLGNVTGNSFNTNTNRGDLPNTNSHDFAGIVPVINIPTLGRGSAKAYNERLLAGAPLDYNNSWSQNNQSARNWESVYGAVSVNGRDAKLKEQISGKKGIDGDLRSTPGVDVISPPESAQFIVNNTQTFSPIVVARDNTAGNEANITYTVPANAITGQTEALTATVNAITTNVRVTPPTMSLHSLKQKTGSGNARRTNAAFVYGWVTDADRTNKPFYGDTQISTTNTNSMWVDKLPAASNAAYPDFSNNVINRDTLGDNLGFSSFIPGGATSLTFCSLQWLVHGGSLVPWIYRSKLDPDDRADFSGMVLFINGADSSRAALRAAYRAITPLNASNAWSQNNASARTWESIYGAISNNGRTRTIRQLITRTDRAGFTDNSYTIRNRYTLTRSRGVSLFMARDNSPTTEGNVTYTVPAGSHVGQLTDLTKTINVLD